jgi:hypothetical protein
MGRCMRLDAVSYPSGGSSACGGGHNPHLTRQIQWRADSAGSAIANSPCTVLPGQSW